MSSSDGSVLNLEKILLRVERRLEKLGIAVTMVVEEHLREAMEDARLLGKYEGAGPEVDTVAKTAYQTGYLAGHARTKEACACLVDWMPDSGLAAKMRSLAVEDV